MHTNRDSTTSKPVVGIWREMVRLSQLSARKEIIGLYRGSLTARTGIHQQELGLGHAEIIEESYAGGYIRPCVAQGS